MEALPVLTRITVLNAKQLKTAGTALCRELESWCFAGKLPKQGLHVLFDDRSISILNTLLTTQVDFKTQKVFWPAGLKKYSFLDVKTVEQLAKLNKILKRLWGVDVSKATKFSPGITGGIRAIKNSHFPWDYLNADGQTDWAALMHLTSENDGLRDILPTSTQGKEITRVFLATIISTRNSDGGS